MKNFKNTGQQIVSVENHLLNDAKMKVSAVSAHLYRRKSCAYVLFIY